MKKFVTAVLVLSVLSPVAVLAQTSDDVILELLRSLEGPPVAISTATTTSATASSAQSPVTPYTSSTTQTQVMGAFNLFSIDGNEPKPDPNVVALKSALETLVLRLATIKGQAASSTAATTTAETPAQPARKPFLRNLVQGSRGADVTALQEILIARGYLFGGATGYFGILTKTAVITFQESEGLPALGTVGPMTRAILNALPAERYSTEPPPPSASFGPVSVPFIASSTSVAASTTQSMGTSTIGTSSTTPMFDLWAAPVSVSMSLLPTEAPVGGSVSITWISQNATSCVASDGWEGPKSTLGAARIEPLEFSLNFVLTCGGPGGVASTSALVVVGGVQ